MGLLAYVLGPSCLHTVSKFLSEIWFFIIHLNVTPHALPLKEIVLLGTSHESKNLGACMITSGSSLDFFFSFFEWVSDSERKDFITWAQETNSIRNADLRSLHAYHCRLKGKGIFNNIKLQHNLCSNCICYIFFLFVVFFFLQKWSCQF